MNCNPAHTTFSWKSKCCDALPYGELPGEALAFRIGTCSLCMKSNARFNPECDMCGENPNGPSPEDNAYTLAIHEYYVANMHESFADALKANGL